MRLASQLLCGLSLVACDPLDGTDACDVPTDAMSMVASVVDNGVNLHAEVDFARGAHEGAPAPFALCDSDELIIAGDAADRTDRSDRVVYSVSLAADAARAVSFELRRPSAAAVLFTIELAPPFEITAPLADEEVSRSQDYMLGWAPELADAEIHIGLAEEIGYGVCLETTVTDHDYKSEDGVVVADNGTWKIPASTIDGGTRDKCDASYRLSRVSTPEYPAELHSGGTVEGRVERLVAFVSVP
jgi:hypothetical protein